MDIQFAKNFRQMTDWLAQGRYALCFGCKDSMRAKNQGLPVDDFDTTRWKEGSSFSSGGGSLSYLNQAPHPNAAKVFINWFLSRRGQIALQKLGDVDDRAQFAAHRYPQGRCAANQSHVTGRASISMWSNRSMPI